MIALDDEITWPQTVLDLLDSSVCNSAAEQEELAGEIHALIEDREIVGYHCTRLADDEIACLEAEGLRPLTEELRRSRAQKPDQSRRPHFGDGRPTAQLWNN